MREQDLHEARVICMVEEVCEQLSLDWVEVNIKFNTKSGEGSDRVCCETTTDWEYRQVVFDWCLPIVATQSDLQLRRVVVHEIVHVLVAPMEMQLPDKELVNKLCELAVENVTRAILEVLPDD